MDDKIATAELEVKLSLITHLKPPLFEAVLCPLSWQRPTVYDALTDLHCQLLLLAESAESSLPHHLYFSRKH